MSDPFPLIDANFTTPTLLLRRELTQLAGRMTDRTLYKQRNRIERMFGHRKIKRAVATRYDQPASSFFGRVHLATARY